MVSGRSEQWQLRAPLPALRRPDGTLQLGLEPPAGLLVGDLPPSAERVVRALSEPCGLDRLHRIAGPSSQRWLDPLLDELRRAGLLRTSAPAAGVAVAGDGRLALLIIRLLLQTVTEPVHVVWPDATAPPAALAGLQRRHPGRLRFGAQLDGPRGPGLTLVCARALEADRSVLRQLRDQAQLVVAASDLGAAVGPLVVPGRTACLRCEDLYRTRRDPAWPDLLLQLSRPRRSDAAPAELQWAAGLAVLHAACWLAGGLPDSLGATLLLDAEGALRVRRLRAHPGCGCGASG